MDETSSNHFPVSLKFPLARGTKVLVEPDDVLLFLKNEREFWQRLADGAESYHRSVILSNLNHLPHSKDGIYNDELLRKLIDTSSVFFPSTVGSGLMLREAAQYDLGLARTAMLLFASKEDIQINSNHKYYAPAQALQLMIRFLANPIDVWDEAAHQKAQLDTLTGQASILSKRFEQKLSAVDSEWKRVIDGYEIRAALKAPREYWRDRQTTQDRLSKSARQAWKISMFVVSTTLLFGFLFVFSGYSSIIFTKTPGESGWIVDALQRLAFLGTAAGLGVWWLRQKLRDLRVREHLAEDAAERVTMIETFSALQGAGLQDADLAPILSALYRPAASFLAEDSGPVLPIEVMLRTIGDASLKSK